MSVIVLHPCDHPGQSLPGLLKDSIETMYPASVSGEESQYIGIMMNTAQRDLVEAFHQMSSEIAGKAAPGTIAILCGVSEQDFHIIRDRDWGTLSAMLILAFPELRWIVPNSGTFGLGAPGTDPAWPLADGSGLHEEVKKTVRRDLEKTGVTDHGFLPERACSICALDDESETSSYLAYIAYRFGFRAVAPLTFGEAEQLFSEPREKFSASFEDLYLSFPDGPTDGTELSRLEQRDDKLLELANVPHRIIVTIGIDDLKSHGESNSRGRANHAYIRAARSQQRQIDSIQKPLGGMFPFWSDVGARWSLRKAWRKFFSDKSLKDGSRWRRALRRSGDRRTFAPGFAWPPIDPPRHSEAGGHSAPGRLLLIAQALIERAEELLDGERSNVETSIRGAVFATEALEMLGGKTPTTSLEALALKHQFEVQAECHFAGVEYGQDLRPRFREIRSNLKFIGRSYSRRKRKEFLINAELMILNRLINIFESYHELDEAESCRKRVRTLHRRAWARKAPCGIVETLLWPMKLLVWPFRWYAETLIGSISIFGLAIILWIGGIGFAVEASMRHSPIESFEERMAILEDLKRENATEEKALRAEKLNWKNQSDLRTALNEFETTEDSFQQAFKAMVGDDLPSHEAHGGNVLVTWLLAIMKASGLFHLGIFLSHLYTLISRR